MKCFLRLIPCFAAFASTLLSATETVLLREPAPIGEEAVAESHWIRMGGREKVHLLQEDNALAWKVEAWSLILNQFSSGELSPPGAKLTFTCKLRLHEKEPSENGFQIGLFHSGGDIVPGEDPATITRDAFLQYTGYLVSLTFDDRAKQGMILYRRKASPEATDGNHLFSANSRNVTFLRSGPGYPAQEDEELDLMLSVENRGDSVAIEVIVNGMSLSYIDQQPEKVFDTVSLMSFSGESKLITILRSEVLLTQPAP